MALVDRLVPRLDRYLRSRPQPWTIVHGDFRADNLLFGGDRVVVVDWQTVGLGPGPGDLSYLLGASLTPDDRRAQEAGLVDRYVPGSSRRASTSSGTTCGSSTGGTRSAA